MAATCGTQNRVAAASLLRLLLLLLHFVYVAWQSCKMLQADVAGSPVRSLVCFGGAYQSMLSFWEASAVINSTQCGSLWHPLRLCVARMGTRIRTRLRTRMHGCIHGCIHLTRLNNSFHPVPSHAVCGLRAATCNFYGNLHFLPATGSPSPPPSIPSPPCSPLPCLPSSHPPHGKSF